MYFKSPLPRLLAVHGLWFLDADELWNNVVHVTHTIQLLCQRILEILTLDRKYLTWIDRKRIIEQLGYDCITAHQCSLDAEDVLTLIESDSLFEVYWSYL